MSLFLVPLLSPCTRFLLMEFIGVGDEHTRWWKGIKRDEFMGRDDDVTE